MLTCKPYKFTFQFPLSSRDVCLKPMKQTKYASKILWKLYFQTIHHPPGTKRPLMKIGVILWAFHWVQFPNLSTEATFQIYSSQAYSNHTFHPKFLKETMQQAAISVHYLYFQNHLPPVKLSNPANFKFISISKNIFGMNSNSWLTEAVFKYLNRNS